MNSHHYHGVICQQDEIVYDFEAEDKISAFVLFSLLIENKFPNAKGQLIEMETGKMVYECRRTAIC